MLSEFNEDLELPTNQTALNRKRRLNKLLVLILSGTSCQKGFVMAMTIVRTKPFLLLPFGRQHFEAQYPARCNPNTTTEATRQ